MYKRMFLLTLAAMLVGCGGGKATPDKSAPVAVDPAKDRATVPKQSQAKALQDLKDRNVTFEVNEANQITSLYLTLNDADNESLSKLGDLSKLRILSLSGSAVTDTVTTHLKGCTSLLSLDLSDTQITDAALPALAGLPRLNTLNLAGTKISDDGLKHLQTLKAISDLSLARTDVSDEGIGNLQSATLRFVDVTQTQATADGVLALRSAIPSLREVFHDVPTESVIEPKSKTTPNVAVAPKTKSNATPKTSARKGTDNPLASSRSNGSDNPLITSRPNAAGSSPRNVASPSRDQRNHRRFVRDLQTWAVEQMGRPKLSNIYGVSTRKHKGGHVVRAFEEGDTDQALLHLSNDERFSTSFIDAEGKRAVALAFGLLGAKHISGDGIAELRQLPRLELDLCELRLFDQEIAQLAKLTNLTSLRMSNTSVDDDSIASLSGLIELRELSLNQTNVSDAGLKELQGLKKLTTLWLAETQITDTGLEQIKAMTSLVELDLHGTRITDKGLSALAELPQLRRLNIQGTHISKEAAAAFADKHSTILIAH